MKHLRTAALATLIASTGLTAVAGDAATPTHRSGHVYYNGSHHYRHRCGGGNGAVGTVAGGVGGGLIGHAVIGGPVGIVAGAVGGGLLGRHLDKVHTRHRHRC
jgi:hypothetical protein